MKIAVASLVLASMISVAPSSAAAFECGAGAPPECYAAQAREQLRLEKRVGPNWASAVRKCSQQTRSMDRGFDAFVSGPGRVKMLGTDQARFAFTKCMSESGQDLE